MPLESQPASVELLLAHGGFVRRLAGALCRDDAQADDLAQDALVTALRRPPAADRPLEPWFATVVRNGARKLFRGESRRGEREAAAAACAPSRTDDPASAALRLDEQRVLVEEVARLDEPFRSTVLLRFFDGLSVADVAARAGVPPATVRTRTARALDRLRAALDRRHGGRREPWLALLLPPDGRVAPPPRRRAPRVAAAVAGVALLVLLLARALEPRPPAPPAPVTTTAGAHTDAAPAQPPHAPPAAAPRRHATSAAAAEGGAARDVEEVAIAAPATAQAARTVRGRVVDAVGAPVAGAAVQAVRAAAGAGAESAAAPASMAASADDGSFVLADAPAGALLLRGSRPGVGVGALGVEPAEGDVADLVLELRAGTRIFGRVTTADGTSPSGALVLIERATSGTRRMHAEGGGPTVGNLVWQPAAEVRPDADGNFEATVPWDYGAFRVQAREEGRLDAGPVTVRLSKERPEERVDLEFAATGALEGRVVAAADGLPVAGAAVTVAGLHPLPLGYAGDAPVRAPARTVTDADGWFRIPLIASGAVLVTATAPGLGDGAARARVPGEVRVELPVAGGSDLAGRVRTTDGAPAAHVEVYAQGEGETHSFRFRTVTAADGTFTLSGLDPGAWTLHAWRGRRNDAANVLPAAAGPFAPGTRGIEIRVETGRVLEGRVVDTGGRPVARAPVSALPEDAAAPRSGGSGFMTTADDGSFRIVGLRDVPHLLIAHPPQERDGALTIARVHGARPGGQPVEIVLDAGLSIDGVVRGPAGAPLESGTVRAEPLDAASDPEPVSWRGGRIGADGRFTIRGLRAGAYRLRLFGWGADLRPALGVLGGPTRPPSLLLAGGESVDAGSRNLVLRADPGLHVRGRVLDEQGDAVAGAQVWVRPPTGEDTILVYSGADGAFDVCGLEPGVGYFVEAYRAGLRPAKLSGVAAGQAPCLLRMELGLAATGRILDADGAPVARARVELVPVDAPDVFQVRGGETDADGAFTAGNLEQVEYRVRVALWVPGTRDVRWIEAGRLRGGDRDVRLALPR